MFMTPEKYEKMKSELSEEDASPSGSKEPSRHDVSKEPSRLEEDHERKQDTLEATISPLAHGTLGKGTKSNDDMEN
ncbi:hypothetical protein OESDEN_20378 [Oesophagostomum dentatum]|uniref:Uncharacterized protein n=1 Tax=Oesophagostomum dentatum TaxID=61180 RepID=A0A0B1S4U9_OESDE|nr:hypothetical protein OESDEN_20378 [Oesophagostomum dentatum]